MKTCRLTPFLALLLGLAFTSHAQPADIRHGLVAYWPLEATDGVSTSDLTPFANHLSVVNLSAGNVAPGRFGNAFTFNGTSTYMTNLHGPDNAATGLPIYRAGSYTITMWVKGAAQQGNYLYSEGSTTDNDPLLILQSGQAAANNTKFDVIIRTDANVPLVNHVVSTTVVFDNTWHHIAWVDDRGSARLYVDGNLDPANFNYTPSGTFTFNTTAIGTLVRANISTAAIFDGQIDDLAVWERALTQGEVQNVMNNSLTTPIPELPPLILLQPVGGTRGLGDRITFTTRAVGNRPLGYQWFKDGEEIGGATSPSLALSNLTPTDSAVYTVAVSNSEGGTASTDATLTVLPDPPVNEQSGLVSYRPLDVVEENELIVFTSPDLYSHNDLLLVNVLDAPVEVAGQFNNALAFNGTTQYGYRQGGFPIYNNPAHSVSLWVNANGVGQSDRRFFAESSTNINANSLFTFGSHATGVDGTMTVFIRNSAGAVLLNRRSTRLVLDGTWHHVVWVDNNGQAKLYIDGVLDETDFSYTRGPVTLEQTAVAAIRQQNVTAYLAGAVDEIAVWNRVLSFSEIQQIHTEGIPAPIGVTAPAITQDPVSQSVFTRANVTFTFTATGTGPLETQWRKGGVDLTGETSVTLNFNDVTLGNAGDYSVVVTNSAGSATSQVATLTVTLRPPPPVQFQVDFNNTGAETPADTEPGFFSFALPAVGPGPVTRSFNGTEVTLAAVGANVNLESRQRATPVNNGAFTQSLLLRDFIFARDAVLDQGMDVTIAFLEPNQLYGLTVWSFDTGSSAGDRISDWFANSVLVRDNYTFNGANLPVNDDTYRFSFDASSDANGTITVQGRRSDTATVGINVFINALKLTLKTLRVQRLEFIPPNTLRLVVELRNPAATHRIDQKTNLTDIDWTEVPDVVFGVPNGNLQEVTFSVPDTATRFYQVVELP